MMYEDVLTDFTRRTLHNLQRLERCSGTDDGAYETTQLINSLLGLLILPQEQMLDRIPDVPLEELHAQGWPRFAVEGSARPHRTLRPLMRALRNAIAHFNIEFYQDSERRIAGVILCNYVRQSRSLEWKATLRLDDLRQLVDRFSALLLEEGRGAPRRPTRPERARPSDS
jgi:hypothetical protein